MGKPAIWVLVALAALLAVAAITPATCLNLEHGATAPADPTPAVTPRPIWDASAGSDTSNPAILDWRQSQGYQD